MHTCIMFVSVHVTSLAHACTCKDDAGNELRDDEDYDQLLDAEDGEEEGGEEPVAWAVPALEPENADEEQEEGGIEEEEPQEEENEEEEETQEEAAVEEMGEDAGGDEAGGVCADVERKAGELEMVDDARGEEDEAHEEEEGREEVLIVPETPAAAVGQPRSAPDGIIEIEATPSPKRLNAAAVARQDSCPKIDAPPPTRLQILTAMYAKLKTLDCITRSAIHVIHVHCSAEDMLRFTDMSYIRREQQARKDREAGVAISKVSKGFSSAACVCSICQLAMYVSPEHGGKHASTYSDVGLGFVCSCLVLLYNDGRELRHLDGQCGNANLRC